MRELAEIVNRGGTSGIGVAAFEKGGFILDGGHIFERGGKSKDKRKKRDFLPSSASDVPPPPVIFQRPIPEDWFFVVAIPHVRKGAHGAEEVEIFRRYCPIDSEDVEKLSRIILMKLLPSVIEKDIEVFGESLTMIQDIGFKRIEVELQQEIIRELFDFFRERTLGYGLSSFGPATYALVRGQKKAEDIAEDTKAFLDEKGIPSTVVFSNTNNHGHEVIF